MTFVALILQETSQVSPATEARNCSMAQASRRGSRFRADLPSTDRPESCTSRITRIWLYERSRCASARDLKSHQDGSNTQGRLASVAVGDTALGQVVR